MSKALVSYIIPLNNAEKTLHQCIDSILNQTYLNLEIILVNDGSTDKSGEICESYSSFDDRIRVYHSNNIGPGGARNIGIDMATGQYICFADADDYVSEKEVEILVGLIENNQIDGIQFGFKHFENGSISDTGNVSDLFPFDTVIEKNTIVENLPIILGGGGGLWFVWRNIYRTSIIQQKKIRFPETFSIGEDSPINLEYLLCCRALMIIQDVLYFKRNSSTSLTGTIYKKDYTQILEKRYDSVLRILEKNDINCEDALVSYTMDHTLPLLIENALCARSLSNEYDDMVESTMLSIAFESSSVSTIKKDDISNLAQCIRDKHKYRFVIIASWIRNWRRNKELFKEYKKKACSIFRIQPK